MIRLEDVEKSYRSGAGETFVLRRIRGEVARGEFVSIMGPSGAGKSTLLAILGMLDADWRGEYWLAGEPVHELELAERNDLAKRHVGFVFQQYHLIEDLTVYENLEIPLSYRNVPGKERQARVAESLDRFQIVAKRDLYPNQLSGGQQQIVAVARALIARPSIILADEPTGSLHSDQGRMIMELLRDLNRKGTTIVQVTHNPEYAAYGDRVIRLADGWIVAS